MVDALGVLGKHPGELGQALVLQEVAGQVDDLQARARVQGQGLGQLDSKIPSGSNG